RCSAMPAPVELSEGTSPLFQVSFPLPDETAMPNGRRAAPATAGRPPAAWKSVSVAFQAGSSHGYQPFAGIVVHAWIDHHPTGGGAVIARLLVNQALSIVRYERLARSAARAEDRAAKLSTEMITSRAEGEAVGILLVRHQITREQAARLLRQASRGTGR